MKKRTYLHNNHRYELPNSWSPLLRRPPNRKETTRCVAKRLYRRSVCGQCVVWRHAIPKRTALIPQHRQKPSRFYTPRFLLQLLLHSRVKLRCDHFSSEPRNPKSVHHQEELNTDNYRNHSKHQHLNTCSIYPQRTNLPTTRTDRDTPAKKETEQDFKNRRHYNSNTLLCHSKTTHKAITKTPVRFGFWL